VTVKSTVFWDVRLCSLVELHLRFGGTRLLPYPGAKSKPDKEKAGSLDSGWLSLVWLALPLHGGSTVLHVLLYMMWGALFGLGAETLNVNWD
jgi:hypothetical protein